MSRPNSIINAQLDYLLGVVNSHRDENCKKIHDEADRQAREIVHQAYRVGRQRLHGNIQDSRRQLRRSIDSARAKQHTRERLHQQQTDHQFLESAWQQLRDTLAMRWQSADNRRLWIDIVFHQSSEVLLEKSWLVEHPADWPHEEKSRLANQVRDFTGQLPEMQSAEDIPAGIRISSGGACVDGSSAGLLVDRLRIESELLSLGRERRSVT